MSVVMIRVLNTVWSSSVVSSLFTGHTSLSIRESAPAAPRYTDHPTISQNHSTSLSSIMTSSLTSEISMTCSPWCGLQWFREWGLLVVHFHWLKTQYMVQQRSFTSNVWLTNYDSQSCTCKASKLSKSRSASSSHSLNQIQANNKIWFLYISELQLNKQLSLYMTNNRHYSCHLLLDEIVSNIRYLHLWMRLKQDQ